MARNLTTEIDGDYLVMRIRIKPDDVQEAPLSGKGRSVVVGTTDGFMKLGVAVGGLNLSVTAGVYGTVPKADR